MRILYGANSLGHGHFSKAAALVPLLEQRGHEVRLISSGADQPPPGYAFRWHRHFPMLAFVATDGQIDYKRTFLRWVRELPSLPRLLFQLRQLVREFQPELIISDFEPLSASPALRPGCEVVAISRQVSLSDRMIPMPTEAGFECKLTRSVVRLFTSGADRLLGYHYEPASYRCVPPIIRQDLETLPRETGSHVVIYNAFPSPDGGTGAELVDWSRRTGVEVKAYGFPEMPRGRAGNVWFCPPDRYQLPRDMSAARAVMTTAGLTTPVEAFLLNKPVCVVPIPGQWEQLVNACHQQIAGIATWLRRWDYDRLLETPPPGADHPLRPWLKTSPDQILDCILGERTERPQPARRAAS